MSAFSAAVAEHADNDMRAEHVEAFLLAEGVKAGVVKRVEIKPAKNPNKINKQLAPWYTEECREAKKAWVAARRGHGRDSDEAKLAAKFFQQKCLQGKRAFARLVPDMMKY